MYILKITGTYSFRDKSPEATIADMLRYDDGELVNWKPVEGPGRANLRFEAEVHSNSFTPERWRSFLLKPELISKTPGKANCSYPNMDAVYKAIHEHR
jgi:hypothetical protein